MTRTPRTIDEVQQVVRESDTLRVRAGGTKSTPVNDEVILNVSGLSGIVEYSPEECVFSATAGTPLADITAALSAHGQYLPFDPPFADEGATIGGTIASGVSGPGRYRYGGVRDFLIGVRVVDGEGRLIRSGGKVVKNAAGFLLHHGIVGSCGRFGVLAEVTLKVFPAPEARRSVVADCGSVEAAFALARRIESLRVDCESVDFGETGLLRVCVAGRESAIAARLAKLTHVVGSGAASVVEAPRCVPLERGQSPAQGTVPGSTVKVAALMDSWQKLRPHVTHAQFMCAGAVAWLTTHHLDALAGVLREAQLVGQVIRGPRAGQRIGHIVHNEFEERVRRVLDPRNRFSAASDPRH